MVAGWLAQLQTCPNSGKERRVRAEPAKEGYSSGNKNLCQKPFQLDSSYNDRSELYHKAISHTKGSLGYELLFFLAPAVEVGKEEGLGKPYCSPT